MVKDNKEFNRALLNAYAPSGYEKESVQIFNTFMKDLKGKHLFMDSMWNSVWAFGAVENPKIKILVEGHMDSCSFLVSNITENGYLHIIRQGGVDKKTIYSSNFVILTKNGDRISAFCPKKAIHLEDMEERDKESFKLENFVLDCGCENAEEVKELGIQVGDCVVYRNDSLNLEFGKDGKYVVSQNLDDKAAILCIYDLAKRLTDGNYISSLAREGICLYLANSSQEECGCRGAHNLALSINPDFSISIDCTHGVVGEIGGKVSVENDIKLRKGLVINFGPSSYRELSWKLQDIAEEKKIPYQLQATGAYGTNTCDIQMHSTNCKTQLLSYPLVSMHTPTEKVAWEDLNSLTDLIEAWIKSKI